jgi:hypothetical protein
MSLPEKEFIIYIKTLKRFDKFTYSGVRRMIPALKSQRFHDILKFFVAIGFIKKMGRVYLWKVDI